MVNPNLGYEIHIAPEEERGTKNFYIFVGVEVEKLDVIPIEMFGKVLPLLRMLFLR